MNSTVVKLFPNATYTAPPTLCQIGRERAVCMLSRPVEGGPICMIHIVAGDGRYLVPVIDMRQFGHTDCFGAAPFVSDAAPENGGGTIKLFVNAKSGDGNDRALVLVSTGIVPVVTR